MSSSLDASLSRFHPRLFAALLSLFAASAISQAGIVVSESYDYSALSDGTTMSGVNVSSGTSTGLSGAYSVGGTGQGAIANYVSTGLTFAGTNFHATSGGAVSLSSPGSATSASSTLNVALNPGAVTGDLYSSYLFQITSASTSNAATAQAWTADTVGGTKRFLTLPEGNTTVPTAEKIQAGYSNVTTTSGSTAVALTLSTTYVAIAKFTNVGTALSAGTTGVTSFWILDVAGYDTWVAGGSLEADLTANALSTVTTTAITTGTFNFSGFQQLAASTNATAGQGTQTLIYDELRYGTSLTDVTSVPEPSTLALALGGMGALIFLNRRRQTARR